MDYGANHFLPPHPAFPISSKSFNMFAERNSIKGDTGEKGNSSNPEG